MDNILKDSRFTKLVNDPRYRQIPKSDRKVKIDKRFQSMFESDKFKVKYTVDKRGRPLNQTSSEDLKKYYELGSEEEEEGSSEDDSDDDDEKSGSNEDVDSANETAGSFVRRPPTDSEEEVEEEKSAEEELEEDKSGNKLVRGAIPKNIKKKLRDLDVDYARGEGVLLSDSSSEEESSEEDDDVLEHGWGELDADAETTEETTSRLALCNMDWDNVKANDLFVLFNSFLPPGGFLRSVTIYPSEFGLKRMKEEELRGPIELTEKKKPENSDEDSEGDNEEGSKYHMEKLRQYQLNRLKYYYAVIVCDSPTTANKIYTDCDGIEYESSATKLDLRFIPDDVTFDEKPHDECLEVSDTSRYKPRLFTTTALQQARVELTWDAANPHRTEALRGAANGDINDADLKNYLACSSESESEEEKVEEKVEEDDTEDVDPITKYKALLQDIETSEQKKKNRDVEMEITWGLGLKEKTQELVKKKLTKGEKMTPFEEMVEKQKEKRKAKKIERKNKIEKMKNASDDSEEEAYSSDDVPSDIDMNDPYFAEEFNNPEFKKPKKTNKNKSKNKKEDVIDEEEEKRKAELELLLEDENDGRAHFSLKKIQEAENETKSKKKRRMKGKSKDKKTEPEGKLQDFEIDVDDNRFSALFTSHHYNIDPSDPNFKKTKAMDTLIQEKLKRRPTEKLPEEIKPSKKSRQDAEMALLVKSLKRKTAENK